MVFGVVKLLDIHIHIITISQIFSFLLYFILEQTCRGIYFSPVIFTTM